MQIINLLPDVQLAKRKTRERNALVISLFSITLGAVVIVWAGLLGITITQNARKNELKKKITVAAAEVTDSKLEKFGVEITDPKTGKKSTIHIEVAGKLLQDQLSSVKQIRSSRLSWKMFLFQVAQVTPANVQIAGITVNEDFTATISAKAGDFVDIAELVSGLKNYPGDLVKRGINNKILEKKEDGIYLKLSSGEELVAADEDELRDLLLSPEGVGLKSKLISELESTPVLEPAYFSSVDFTSVKKDVTKNEVSTEIKLKVSPELFKK